MRSARWYATALVWHRLGLARPARPGDPGSTVALSDSLTAGHGMPAARLLARDSYIDVLAHRGAIACVANRGVGGSTSKGVARRAPADVPHGVERVIVLAGTNDVRMRPDIDTLANLSSILDVIAAVGARPVFGLLPPLDQRPAQVRAVNDRIRGWASEHPEILLVDHHAALAGPDDRFRRGLSSDGVHVTAAGAALMADAAEQAIATVAPQGSS